MKSTFSILAGLLMAAAVYAGVDFTSAKLYRKQNEWAKALESYGKAISSESPNNEVYFERGLLLKDIAQDSLDGPLAAGLTSNADDRAYALSLMILDDFDKAAETGSPEQEKAIKKFRKKLDEAIDALWWTWYNPAVAADSPYVKIAASELPDSAKPKLERAIRDLDLAMRALPTRWNAHAQKAAIQERLGMTAEANESWKQALVSLGASDLQKKKPEEYADATSVVHLHLLQNYYNLDQFTKTVEMADEILATDPASLDAVQYKAFALARMAADTTLSEAQRTEMKTSAIKALEDARKARPEDDVLLFYLGQFYLQVGDTAQALSTFDEYLKLVPDDKDVLFAQGVIYLQEGRFMNYEKARDKFESVTKQHPDFGAAWINYGITLIRLGKNAEGKAALEKGQQLE